MLTYLSYVKGWKLRCQVDTEIVQISSPCSEQWEKRSIFEVPKGAIIMSHNLLLIREIRYWQR